MLRSSVPFAWRDEALTDCLQCLERLADLSKRPSDPKQNGTQEKTPFSGTVFHTLSHGVIRIVASVSSKNTTV